MSSLDRFKFGANSFGTSYIDNLFKPSISFRPVTNYDNDVINEIVRLKNSRPAPFVESQEKRSFLDRSLDLLMAPVYIGAGAIDGLVRDDKGVFEGAWGGVKAANPFGKGFEEGETTYSDVLESSGWKDDAFWGSNFLRGTAGFALDVLLDPTTYMTFGVGAVVKGTGRVGKAAQTVEKLAKESPEFAAGIREAGELTQELAESIVMRSHGITDPSQVAKSALDMADTTSTGFKLSRDQLAQEATELRKTYNNLIGVGRTGQGMTIGVQNMPFGDWVAKKLNIDTAPKTLISDTALRSFSDKTGISKGWAATREAVLGNQMISYLTKKTGLKELAEVSPQKLYEYVGALTKLQSKDIDKLARERAIKDFGERLAGLSPASQKKLIKALENPSIMKTIRELSDEGKAIVKERITAQFVNKSKEVAQNTAKLASMRREYRQKGVEELRKYREEVKVLKKQENLTTAQADALEKIDNDISVLIQKKMDITNAKPVKDNSKLISELESELENTSILYNKMTSETVEGVVSKYSGKTPQEIGEMSDAIAKNYDSANNIHKKLKETLKNAIDDVDAKDIQKQIHNAKLHKEVESENLRKLLSEYLYGNEKAIPKAFDYGRLQAVAQALKHTEKENFLRALGGEFGGKSVFTRPSLKKSVLNQTNTVDIDFQGVLRSVLEEADMLDELDIRMYKYLAKKHDYQYIDDIYKRMNELSETLKINNKGEPGVEMTPEMRVLFDELNTLANKLAERNADLRLLQAMPKDERAKFLQAQIDADTRDEMFEVLFSDVDRSKAGSDILNDLSDTRERDPYAGTKYNSKLNVEDTSFMEEAQAWGRTTDVETEELHRFRQNYHDKDYTLEEVHEHSFERTKERFMEMRQKRLVKSSLSKQAKTKLDAIAKDVDKLKNLTYKYNLLKRGGASEKALSKMKQEGKELSESIKKSKLELREKTNYETVLNQAKNLDPEEVAFMSAQLQASLLIQNKFHSRHKFEHLTTAQKNRLSGMSYGAVKEWQKKYGELPKKKDLDKFLKFVEDTAIAPAQKKLQEIVAERSKKAQAVLVRDKVDVDTGVEVKIGDEIVRGTVELIEAEKEAIKRTRVEKRQVTDGEGTFKNVEVEVPKRDPKTGRKIIKNGKPVMEKKIQNKYFPPKKTMIEEQIEEVIGHRETGVYTYHVKLADGSIKKVQANDIVGTFVHDNTFQINTGVIQKHAESEIKRVKDEMTTLRRRIGALKGAETKSKKANEQWQRIAKIKTEQIDTAIRRLEARKEEELAKLMRLDEVAREQAKVVDKLKVAREFNTKAYDDTLESLAHEQELIEKALDDTDALEILYKMEFGDDALREMEEELIERGYVTERFTLDDKLTSDWDDDMKEFALKLRHDFVSAGLDEVAVRKLDLGALQTMADKYFPRALSDEGKEFFDKNPELIEKYSAVAREYGFGKEFNPFTKSRSELGKELGLHEMNDKFQAELGVRIFEENIGKAYVKRMLTSSDMVYDQRAMSDLMFKFGHPANAEETMKGYMHVVNYGMLKDHVRERAILTVKDMLAGRKVSNEEFAKMFDESVESIMNGLGLPKSILDGETTPFIKLESQEAVKKFMDGGGQNIIAQVNKMTINRANQARQLIMERDENRLLQIYDKFQTFFKLNQTTVMPSFQVRNHIGAMFVGWLGVGKEALNIRTQKEMYQALKNYGNAQELRKFKPVVVDGKNKTYYMDEVMDLANTYRVIDEGFMMKDFASHSYSEGTRLIPGKYDPFNTRDFFAYKIGSKVATYSDNINRLTQFTALLKQGKTPAEASEIVRKYMFDYSDLTVFEQRVMKRIFPYYTYMRKNIPLMVGSMVEHADKMRLVAKFMEMPETMVNEEDRIAEGERLGFAQDWIQMPFNLNSSSGMEPVLMNTNLPFMQLRDLPTDDDLGETARTFFAQTAPMLKVPFELATNWNSFFDSPIAYEDGSQVTPRVLHVMSQLAAFNAVKQFATASTADDKLLSLLNTGTGIKMSTYDIEGARDRILEEAYNDEFKFTLRNILGTGIRFADGLVDNTRANISDIAVQLAGRPWDAFTDAEGVMAPISVDTYNELPEEEKKKYTLDAETTSYISKRALEFQAEQAKEGGVIKNLIWALVEDPTPGKQMVRVDKVIDGDTFVGSDGKNTHNIRLLLVDTPESAGDYEDNPQVMGKEASRYTTDMILGKDVKIFIDDKLTYGRKLAFVEVGGQSLQESLVEEGYGKVREYDEKYTDYANELYNIEEKAYQQRKGIWEQEGNAVPYSNSGFIR